MIFALLDYRDYAKLSGRYARSHRNVMGAAFQGAIPPDKLNRLKPGDVLLVQTLGSPISWLIMYLASSEVSHVCSCIGDGKIVHATTDAGVVVEPIESLFNETTRILIAQRDLRDDERENFVSSVLSLVGMPYDSWGVFGKACQIVSGRDWVHFRWKFAADIFVILFILDIPALVIFNSPLFSWLVPVYLFVVLLHSLLWKFWPLKRGANTVKPNDMVASLLSSSTLLYDEKFITGQIKEEIELLRDYARRRSGSKSGELRKRRPR